MALLTRTTWLLFFALWPVLALVCLWQRPTGASRVALRLVQLGLIAALGLLILNLGYGFQGTGRSIGEFRFVSRALAGEQGPTDGPGNRFRGTALQYVPVPLPADYVIGMDLQRRDFEGGWPFYLNGTWDRGGKWYFYLYALLLKVPLGAWGLFILAVVLLAFRRSATAWREELLVGLPAVAILVLVSSQTGLNYFRYALPVLPFALIVCSRCATLIASSSKCLGALVIALTLWVAVSGLRVFPHNLSYFNEAAGGPANAHRHLVDSNLDWGQDLLELKEWLDAHPDHGRLGLAHFHVIDPRVVGIEYELPPADPRPGLYAVSVHFVQGGSFIVPDGQGRRSLVPLRRYAYFQLFRPVAKAGYTLWIFELTGSEVNDVRRRMGLPGLPSQ